MEALEAERTIEAEGRVENLQELVGVARRVRREPRGRGRRATRPLEEFLAQISLLSDQDSMREGESLITLMTLHNAKGLEYEAVFLIGCEEGVFPHSRSIEEGNLEEERRLCYVGLTRARQRLYLTCARRRMLFGGRRLEPAVAVPAASCPTSWSSARRSATAHRLAGRAERRVAAGERGRRLRDRREPQAGPTPEVAFRTGDDVVHASFGEGVVTSVEPGSVVVVRFASDGTERKLMADYAPLRKAS